MSEVRSICAARYGFSGFFLDYLEASALGLHALWSPSVKKLSRKCIKVKVLIQGHHQGEL